MYTDVKWLPIPAFESLYEISSLGRVRSLASNRILPSTRKIGTRKEKMLANTPRVYLGSEYFSIKKLVADLFLPPPTENEKFLCHIDGDTTNRAANNLVWYTQEQKIEHDLQHGKRKYRSKREREAAREKQCSWRAPRVRSKFVSIPLEVVAPILDPTKENWLPIPRFENVYLVSDQGRVKSMATYAVYAPTLMNGYPSVSLVFRGERKFYKIHRLVAETFLASTDPTRTSVNHKNRNKLDNRVENLEWCTLQENNAHTRYVTSPHTGNDNTEGMKLNWEEACEIKTSLALGVGKRTLARQYGVSRTTIDRIQKGKTWKVARANAQSMSAVGLKTLTHS